MAALQFAGCFTICPENSKDVRKREGHDLGRAVKIAESRFALYRLRAACRKRPSLATFRLGLAFGEKLVFINHGRNRHFAGRDAALDAHHPALAAHPYAFR